MPLYSTSCVPHKDTELLVGLNGHQRQGGGLDIVVVLAMTIFMKLPILICHHGPQ